MSVFVNIINQQSMYHAMWIFHEHLENMAKNFVHLACSGPIVFSRFYL